MKKIINDFLIMVIVGVIAMSCCPKEVTNSGKMLIRSYDELAKNQATNQCAKIPEMHCTKFYIPKGDLIAIDSLPKTAFSSYFRTDTNHFSYNGFATPICTDSTVDTNGNKKFMPMWMSVYSANCPACYPDTTMLARKKYADWEWQRVIFVPIEKYKLVADKHDFGALQKSSAINPQKIKSIGEPYLEPCDGYLSSLDTLLKARREDTKSITGIICKVLTQESPNGVLCYAFNKESFGTSSPYLHWKVKPKWWLF